MAQQQQQARKHDWFAPCLFFEPKVTRTSTPFAAHASHVPKRGLTLVVVLNEHCGPCRALYPALATFRQQLVQLRKGATLLATLHTSPFADALQPTETPSFYLFIDGELVRGSPSRKALQAHDWAGISRFILQRLSAQQQQQQQQQQPAEQEDNEKEEEPQQQQQGASAAAAAAAAPEQQQQQQQEENENAVASSDVAGSDANSFYRKRAQMIDQVNSMRTAFQYCLGGRKMHSSSEPGASMLTEQQKHVLFVKTFGLDRKPYYAIIHKSNPRDFVSILIGAEASHIIELGVDVLSAVRRPDCELPDEAFPILGVHAVPDSMTYVFWSGLAALDHLVCYRHSLRSVYDKLAAAMRQPLPPP